MLKVLENKMKQKQKLSDKIKNSKIQYNKQIPLRKLSDDELNDNNVISVFESSLTRTIGIKKNPKISLKLFSTIKKKIINTNNRPKKIFIFSYRL